MASAHLVDDEDVDSGARRTLRDRACPAARRPALCRWRLGDFAYAHAICESLLWLNPNDNQGVRDIIDPIARKLPWLPQDAWG